MRYEGAMLIGDVIGDYIKKCSLDSGLLRVRVFDAWDKLDIDGINLGRSTLSRTFKDGVLTCGLNSSVLRSHLSARTEEIRLGINASLKSERVKKVVIR